MSRLPYDPVCSRCEQPKSACMCAFPDFPDEPECTALRDEFAGRALAAMMVTPFYASTPVPIMARYAYEYADAMLAERNKRGTQ